MTRTVTDEQLTDFLGYAQQMVEVDYHLFMPKRPEWTPVLQFDNITGRTKYAKIFTDNGTQKMVWGFIRLADGDVLKPEGWKKPALNFARGNIADTAHGLGRARWTGIG